MTLALDIVPAHDNDCLGRTVVIVEDRRVGVIVLDPHLHVVGVPIADRIPGRVREPDDVSRLDAVVPAVHPVPQRLSNMEGVRGKNDVAPVGTDLGTLVEPGHRGRIVARGRPCCSGAVEAARENLGGDVQVVDRVLDRHDGPRVLHATGRDGALLLGGRRWRG